VAHGLERECGMTEEINYEILSIVFQLQHYEGVFENEFPNGYPSSMTLYPSFGM
jgi:hypothetical protein